MIDIYKLPKLKLLWAFGLVVVLSSCEKDIVNTIPKDQPTITDYQNAIKKVLVEKSVNDSVWLTQPLGSNPSFHVAFTFKEDGTTALYQLSHNKPTIKGQLQENLIIYASDPDAVEILEYLLGAFANFNNDDELKLILNNPANKYFKDLVELFFPLNAPVPPVLKAALLEDKNTYSINGVYNASLTFLNKSFLSDLKKARRFDFDFKIKAYNRDSVNMEGYYSTNANKIVTLKQASLTDIKVYVQASNVIVAPLTFDTQLKVGGKVVAGSGTSFLKEKTRQGFDSENRLMVFDLIKDKVTEPEFSGITSLKAVNVNYTPGGANPPSGTVLVKFIGYNNTEKGSVQKGQTVELIVK